MSAPSMDGSGRRTRSVLFSSAAKTSAFVAVTMAFTVLMFSGLFSSPPNADPTLAPVSRPSGAAGGRSVEPAPPQLMIAGPDRAVEDEEAPPVIAENALFVDGVNGSSSNPGTAEAPFFRPLDAFEVVTPGTTIYLRGGVYDDLIHGSNTLRRSGTPDAWISIEPYPGERVEIVAGGEWGNGFSLFGVSYVSVSGFVIEGRADSIHGSGVFAKDNSHDVVVRGNYIEGFGGAGISFVRSSRAVIEGNEIRENAHRSFYQSSGISLFEAEGPVETEAHAWGGTVMDPSSFDNVIRGNYVVGNYNGVPSRRGDITDGNCVIIDWFNPVNYQGTTLVENNVCVENGGRGVHVFNSSNVVARNNTMVGNARTLNLIGDRVEMTAVDGENIEFYNNLVLNSDGVKAYVQSGADDAVFRNNFVASGAPPGPSNVEIPVPREQVLGSLSGDAPIDSFRPVGDGPAVGVSSHTFQPGLDASGVERPFYGAVGALEPDQPGGE